MRMISDRAILTVLRRVGSWVVERDGEHFGQAVGSSRHGRPGGRGCPPKAARHEDHRRGLPQGFRQRPSLHPTSCAVIAPRGGCARRPERVASCRQPASRKLPFADVRYRARRRRPLLAPSCHWGPGPLYGGNRPLEPAGRGGERSSRGPPVHGCLAPGADSQPAPEIGLSESSAQSPACSVQVAGPPGRSSLRHENLVRKALVDNVKEGADLGADKAPGAL
jgi:hypothetical protein